MEASVSDLAGRVLVLALLKTDKDALNVSHLPSGVYMVHVVDKETGERMVRKIVKE